MLPHITFLPFEPLMHLVVSTRITHGPGDYMTVDMRDALSRRFAILHRDVESVGFVEPLESALDAGHTQEEIGDLVFGQVAELRLDG